MTKRKSEKTTELVAFPFPSYDHYRFHPIAIPYYKWLYFTLSRLPFSLSTSSNPFPTPLLHCLILAMPRFSFLPFPHPHINLPHSHRDSPLRVILHYRTDVLKRGSTYSRGCAKTFRGVLWKKKWQRIFVFRCKCHLVLVMWTPCFSFFPFSSPSHHFCSPFYFQFCQA